MATSVLAAAEANGIPSTTVDYWFNSPEFVKLRDKTREDRAEEAAAFTIVVLAEIRRRLPEFEPRDLSVLWGIMTDKAQLLGGHATARTETRTLTEGLEDHEREALRQVIADAIAEQEAIHADGD